MVRNTLIALGVISLWIWGATTVFAQEESYTIPVITADLKAKLVERHRDANVLVTNGNRVYTLSSPTMADYLPGRSKETLRIVLPKGTSVRIPEMDIVWQDGRIITHYPAQFGQGEVAYLMPSKESRWFEITTSVIAPRLWDEWYLLNQVTLVTAVEIPEGILVWYSVPQLNNYGDVVLDVTYVMLEPFAEPTKKDQNRLIVPVPPLAPSSFIQVDQFPWRTGDKYTLQAVIDSFRSFGKPDYPTDWKVFYRQIDAALLVREDGQRVLIKGDEAWKILFSRPCNPSRMACASTTFTPTNADEGIEITVGRNFGSFVHLHTNVPER